VADQPATIQLRQKMEALRAHRDVALVCDGPRAGFWVTPQTGPAFPLSGMHAFIARLVVPRAAAPRDTCVHCARLWTWRRLRALAAARNPDPPSRCAMMARGAAVGPALVARRSSVDTDLILACVAAAGWTVVGAEVPIASTVCRFATAIDLLVQCGATREWIVIEIKVSGRDDFQGAEDDSDTFRYPFHQAPDCPLSRAALQACLAATTLAIEYSDVLPVPRVRWAVLRVTPDARADVIISVPGVPSNTLSLNDFKCVAVPTALH
jgi:hypothetical protein